MTRLMPSRYLTIDKPAIVKKRRAFTQHISAPLKGLDLSTALAPSDKLTATVLKNFIIEEDRIRVRAGRRLIYTDADAQPIETLVPYYGIGHQLLAATAGKLANVLDGSLLHSGFAGNDWSWTSFANLSQRKYTVMCNGADGVWSWDGDTIADGPAVTAVGVSKANPAVVTVAAADIDEFEDGDWVEVAGATGDWAVINGRWFIDDVNVVISNGFKLMGVNTSAISPALSGTVTVKVLGSFVKETVTVPPAMTWVDPDEFNIVVSHMNRLWFTDKTSLSVFYLPIQQKSGEVKEYPMGALFQRGGTIKAMYTWTVDGGRGMDDQLVVLTDHGETAIFSGTDPDTAADGNFTLVGVFRFGPPTSKQSVAQYGGDLYVMTSVGLLPMSSLFKADQDQFAKVDKNVQTAFLEQWTLYRDVPGWAVHLNPSSGRLVCNMPGGAPNTYRQLVRHMPKPVWSEWGEIPGRSWGWLEPDIYLGSDDGKVYAMHPRWQSDDGLAINVDVQPAWSLYKTSAIKHFKMVLPYIISDGYPKPYVDIKVDYDFSPAFNQPDVSLGALGAEWNVAAWDEDPIDDGWFWAGSGRIWNNWSGVGRLGRVGAPRVTAAVLDCDFAIAGWDVLFETGSVFG